MKKLMTLEEFSECVRKGVKAGLPHELEKAKVNIKYEKDGCAQIQINRPCSNTIIHYTLTLDYREYLSGKCTPECVIANILNSRILYYVPEDFCSIDVSDFEYLKKRIVRRIISSKPQYTERMKNRPIKFFKDMPLAMVWELHSTDLCHGKDEIARMPVTMDMVNDWGISVDELEQIAQKNNPLLRPAQIRYMSKILSEEGYECEEQRDIVVITNPAIQDGAVAVTYPGVRETLIDMLGDDVYIIPSSVHECIAIAKSGADSQYLYEMVCDVNRTVTDANDFLADDLMEFTQDGRLVSVFRRLKKGSSIDENHTFV